MSFREVNTLRKSGRLQEAYDMAQDDLRNERSEWTYSAMFWVLRDLCNQQIANQQIEKAREYLSQMTLFHQEMNDNEGIADKAINMLQRKLTPNWELVKKASDLSRSGDVEEAFNMLWEAHNATPFLPILHEDLGWVIYRYLSKKYKEIGSEKVRRVLWAYINLENERPSLLHSQFLNFALNYSKFDANFGFVSYLRLWGADYLRQKDFEESHDSDGKSIPSLMSRIARVMVNYPYDGVSEFVELLPINKEMFIEMLKDNYFWKLYNSTEGGITATTWNLFNQYLDFFPNAPASSSHSKVLGLAERVMKEGETWRFYNFFKHWNPEKLREEDWKEEKSDTGGTYKPLAVKSLKKAKEALETLSQEQTDDLQWLINLYGTAVEKFPDDDWLIRSKALLLIKAGQIAEAQNVYKSLCLKMGDKYYMWQEFSYCCVNDDIKIALLCKALSLENNEDFIGKIRFELAELLIKVQKYENATVELNQYKKHYEEKGWRVDPKVDVLLARCVSATPALKDNMIFYSENIPIAEDYAYGDIPFTELVQVEHWKNDAGKTMITFVDGDSIELAINKKRFQALCNSHEGKVWKMKLYRDEKINTIPSPYLWQPPKMETIVKYIPLCVSPSETADWQILPVKYGYVQYVNTEKKVYHIYSTDSYLSYEHYEKQVLSKGDFVAFRQYKKKVKDGYKFFFKGIRKCEKTEAISQFKCRIVAVDDVNKRKQLFHFVLGPNLISGLIHFDRTPLRPSVGDCLKIHYFVRKIDDKKNPDQQKKVIEVLQIEQTDEINSDLIKNISGNLVLKYHDYYEDGEPDFAFIGDYYVHKSILEEYGIEEDCHVDAKVIYSGDGRWKVYEIQK